VPALLADRDLALSPATLTLLGSTAEVLRTAAADMPADHLPLSRLLLRSEGVASSFVEGIRAPLADVVVAEEGLRATASAATRSAGPETAASWIAANLAALTAAVASAGSEPFSVEMLCRWHVLLMQGSPVPARYVGVVRDEQGWIGGSSPLDASLVTPPPDRLDALLADLVVFANRDDLDPVLQAAASHAQLEVIHPFGDGNGRVGRLLLSWLLARRLALVTPPPVSVRIAADPGGYLSGLTLWRLGQHEPWVRWMAGAVTGAGRAQRALVVELAAVRSRWRQVLEGSGRGRPPRSAALAWQTLDLLPGHLVLTAAIVAVETGRTPRAAQNALGALAGAGILVRYDGPTPVVSRGRRPARYVSPELLGLSGSTALR